MYGYVCLCGYELQVDWIARFLGAGHVCLSADFTHDLLIVLSMFMACMVIMVK